MSKPLDVEKLVREVKTVYRNGPSGSIQLPL